MAKYNPLKEIKKAFKQDKKEIKVQALEIGRDLARQLFKH